MAVLARKCMSQPVREIPRKLLSALYVKPACLTYPSSEKMTKRLINERAVVMPQHEILIIREVEGKHGLFMAR